MTHLVTDSCIACKYTDCVSVCPVDCFHEGPNFLVIDPEECIDCGLCLSDCPVNAIKTEYDLADNEKKFLKLNKEMSIIWPIINNKKKELPDAERMSKITDKFDSGLLQK